MGEVGITFSFKCQPIEAKTTREISNGLNADNTTKWKRALAHPTLFIPFRFHVLFIDDFFRFIKLYPIHNKSVVFSYFMYFRPLVENRFSTKIKQMQSNNGGIFHINFKNYYKHVAFINVSRALIYHRHVIEVGISLSVKSHLPKRLWVDAFMMVIYFINPNIVTKISLFKIVWPWTRLLLPKNFWFCMLSLTRALLIT